MQQQNHISILGRWQRFVRLHEFVEHTILHLTPDGGGRLTVSTDYGHYEEFRFSFVVEGDHLIADNQKYPFSIADNTLTLSYPDSEQYFKRVE